jgi:hypothetical protein
MLGGPDNKHKSFFILSTETFSIINTKTFFNKLNLTTMLFISMFIGAFAIRRIVVDCIEPM